MKATHTPGPWRYCAVTEKIWAADGQEDVGAIRPGPKLAEWEPNGLLMAAAPDLLDALRTMLAVYCEDDGITPEACQAAEQAARAALKAAEEGRP